MCTPTRTKAIAFPGPSASAVTRKPEALPLLFTLSSGVKGFTTIHAGSARQALSRLRFICQLAETGSEIPMSALNTLVSEAVDIVVHTDRTPEGLRVAEIVAVEDLSTVEATNFTVTEVFQRRAGEPLRWTGNLPVRAGRTLWNAGFDVRALLGAHEVRAG